MSGKIESLLIAQDTKSPMQNVNQIVLEVGKGIFGDRYYNQTGTYSNKGEVEPDRDVTIIEKEKIDAFNETVETKVSHEDLRRNIVVSNCDLNALVDKEFQIGEVVLKGMRLCEPCDYLGKKLNNDAFLKGMMNKGGLRAKIIKGGSITLTSQVEVYK